MGKETDKKNEKKEEQEDKYKTKEDKYRNTALNTARMVASTMSDKTSASSHDVQVAGQWKQSAEKQHE